MASGGFVQKGKGQGLRYPRIPVFELIRSASAQWPGHSALIFGGMELNFRELDLLSDRFAAALADMGMDKGDRVGVHLPNCHHFAVAYYGILKAGAVFVPLDHDLSERELLFRLRDAGVGTYLGLDLTFRIPRRVLPQTPVRQVILTSLADCYPRVSSPVKPLRHIPVPPEPWTSPPSWLTTLRNHPTSPLTCGRTWRTSCTPAGSREGRSGSWPPTSTLLPIVAS